MPIPHPPALLAFALALTGCGGAADLERTGRILISISTSGDGADADGYLVTLDGVQPLVLESNGSAVYLEVPAGSHVVQLAGLARNCAVAGSNPRSVTVQGDESAEVRFSIVCGPPISGGFRIVVTTTGTDLDEDGYQLSVAGTPLRHIDVDAEEVYQDLAPGVHLVTLKDVADNCDLQGGNPQPFTVVVGKTVRVTLRVLCGGSPEPL